MAGVNLLPGEENLDQGWLALRSRVMAVATVVLVGYLVAVAAGGGWWWYLRMRSVRTSAETASLQEQLDQRARTEVWLRLLADRTRAISDLVGGRSDLAGEAAVLVSRPQVVVIGWDRQSAVEQTVQAKAADAQALEDYARFLGTRYDQVMMTNLGIDQDSGGWKAVINLGVVKKDVSP